MKTYKIILASMILLAILTLGAVSAEDNATVDSLAADDVDDSISASQDELQASSADDSILSAKKDSGMTVDFVTQDSDEGIYKIDEQEDISADVYNQDYLRVKFPSKVSGKLSLYIDDAFKADRNITAKTHYLFANDVKYNLTEGSHSWMMKYSGDASYSAKTLKGTFALNLKNDTDLKIGFVSQDENGKIYEIDENRDIFVNDHDSDYIMVKMPERISGKLSLYIDKKLSATREITGKTHYLFINSKIYNLSEGNHTWKIRYSGDDDHRPKVMNGTFTLNPADPSFVKKDSKMQAYIVTKDLIDSSVYKINATNDIGQDTKGNDYFKIQFPKYVSGTLSLYIDGKLKAEKKISKKTHYMYVNVESYNLNSGNHKWEIRYSGDDEYNSSSQTGTFTLHKVSKILKPSKTTTMTVVKTKNYKKKTAIKKYYVTLKSNKKALKKVYVYLTITGKKYKKTFYAKTNANGVATIKIKGLTKKGSYTGTLKFKGNKNYPAVKNTLKIKIDKKTCKITAKKKTVTVKTKPVLGSTSDYSYNGFVDVSEAYDLLNAFRAEKGVWVWNPDNVTKTYYNTNSSNALEALEVNTEFERTAQIRALELVEKYSHTRPDGNSCWTVYPNEVDVYYPSGENIARGHTSCKKVIEAWTELNDPYDGQGHRRNMLNPVSQYIGIAGFKLDGVIYWVQSFGLDYNNERFIDMIKWREQFP